ncbi:MAG: GntR family transcriptional regulator [Chloroflexi bacterium]|nr:GntR family transcriptional regulator [Chloroflexota bacterium]MBV9547308.1 GntR family transcriptional regulator [Chloroflexota bacterium]
MVLQRPETLTNAVVRCISDAILRGEFAPGQALPEMHLADRMGTSRSTVREASRTLAEQGLVEVYPHRGVFVAQLSARRAREIFTLRAELESYAVRLAVERGAYTSDQRRENERALMRLEAAVAGGDDFEVAEADMRFHEVLARASDHRVLLETLAGLRLRMRQAIVFTKLLGSDIETETVTHRRILESVHSGNAHLAARAIHDHITQSGELLVEKLSETEVGDAKRGGLT